MKAIWFAVLLAALYIALVILVAWQDFSCGGGLDLNFCGFNTTILTFPSQITVGRIFARMGMHIDYMHRQPNNSDLGQLAVHIIVTAAFVFLIGLGIGRLASYFKRLTTR